jgi:hypothetical protein
MEVFHDELHGGAGTRISVEKLLVYFTASLSSPNLLARNAASTRLGRSLALSAQTLYHRKRF